MKHSSSDNIFFSFQYHLRKKHPNATIQTAKPKFLVSQTSLVCQDSLLNSVVSSEDINIEENGAGNFVNLDVMDKNGEDSQNENDGGDENNEGVDNDGSDNSFGSADENDEESSLLCKEEQDSHRYGIRYRIR
jgi:hypothetical protein